MPNPTVLDLMKSYNSERRFRKILLVIIGAVRFSSVIRRKKRQSCQPKRQLSILKKISAEAMAASAKSPPAEENSSHSLSDKEDLENKGFGKKIMSSPPPYMPAPELSEGSLPRPKAPITGLSRKSSSSTNVAGLANKSHGASEAGNRRVSLAAAPSTHSTRRESISGKSTSRTSSRRESPTESLNPLKTSGNLRTKSIGK
jgi:hypothetical protein